MSDDDWGPSPEELDRLRKHGPISESDRRFIQTYAAIAHALDACENSEAVTLLLSTCRNEFMTTNAIFADLRLTLTTNAGQDSLFDRAVQALRPEGRAGGWKDVRTGLGMLLSQAREKRAVWDDRERLITQYEVAANQLRGTTRDDALGVLNSAPATQHPSGHVWPAQYTKISQRVSRCDKQLEELRILTGIGSAAFSLLDQIAQLDVPNAADRASAPATLFEDEAAPESDGKLRWSSVIDEVRRRSVWHVGSHAGGGHVITLTDLPVTADDGGWPTPETVRHAVIVGETEIGAESAAQLDQLLDLAVTAIECVKVRLRRSFRANVADRPMPDPFLIDLSDPDPVTDSKSRSFSVTYSKLASEADHPDTTTIAALKIAIPENWHNRQGHYRYNEDIAQVDGLRDVIEEAINTGADRSIPFLLLPEYFIPRKHLVEVKTLAARRGVSLIGGIEGRLVEGSCANEALLYFPDSGTDLRQGKQGPSVYEIRDTMFVTDGRLQIVRNTLLGTIGVVVCSDFLEADIVHGLAVATRHRLHALIVVARNPRPDIFTTLARADAVRLYCNVVVVNSTDGDDTQRGDDGEGGCIVAAPSGKTGLQSLADRIPLGRLSGTEEPFPLPELLVWDLNVAGVHSRLNRRQDPHFLTPSVFAKQG